MRFESSGIRICIVNLPASLKLLSLALEHRGYKSLAW